MESHAKKHGKYRRTWALCLKQTWTSSVARSTTAQRHCEHGNKVWWNKGTICSWDDLQFVVSIYTALSELQSLFEILTGIYTILLHLAPTSKQTECIFWHLYVVSISPTPVKHDSEHLHVLATIPNKINIHYIPNYTLPWSLASRTWR